jgi:hypothetical protein
MLWTVVSPWPCVCFEPALGERGIALASIAISEEFHAVS